MTRLAASAQAARQGPVTTRGGSSSLPPLPLDSSSGMDPNLFASATSSGFVRVPRPPGSGLPTSEQLLSQSRLKRLQAVEQPYIAPQPPYMHYEEMKRRNHLLEYEVRRLRASIKKERRERQVREGEESQRAADNDLARQRTKEAWEADVSRIRDECERLVKAAKNSDEKNGLLDELAALHEQQKVREAA